MDHVRFHPTCLEPTRQPEAVAAGFEGKRNPRDRAPSPDHLIPPAMQHCKQPFWARLELLARLTLNPGKHAGDEPARLAHLEDGNDRSILVQGDEGPAQVVRLGHRGTPSLDAATKLPFPRRPPHRISWVPLVDAGHEDAITRRSDLIQLERIASGYPSRERFLTELALDPPDATSDQSGAPLLDEDYLILSTIHSAKGQEWKSVFVLNVVDGCIPSDLGTGASEEIEEERRL